MIPGVFPFVGVEDTSRTILTIPLMRFSGRLQGDEQNLEVPAAGTASAPYFCVKPFNFPSISGTTTKSSRGSPRGSARLSR